MKISLPNISISYLLPRLFILFWVLLGWGIGGLFVAFVCNGGAGGSSNMSWPAWIGVAIYSLLFFRAFRRWIANGLFSKLDN
jgi:hypothetical protein